jgi:hypothetical protein
VNDVRGLITKIQKSRAQGARPFRFVLGIKNWRSAQNDIRVGLRIVRAPVGQC